MTSQTFPGESGLSPDSDSSQGLIFTPAGSASPLPPAPISPQPGKRIKLVPLSQHGKEKSKQEYSDHESDDDDMSGRPPMHRPTGGLSNTQSPLLKEGKMVKGRRSDERMPGQVGSRRFTSQRDTFRSRSPKHHRQPSENEAKKKYLYASFFLVVSLISFVVQTESAVYVQHTLHWNKAYCMLWLTHGSWIVLWPVQLLILRAQNLKTSWPSFWLQHKRIINSTAQMVEAQTSHPTKVTTSRNPWAYMIKTTAFITTFLTMAGASWYVAIDLTSPSDLTAIYNCSAFFAYVFSILLLKEKARLDKIFSVALAILGVLVVAYGDSGHPKGGSHSGGATNPDLPEDAEPDNRALGNLIIGIGSVMYGLYEVLYKKYACPPEGTSPIRGMLFANTFGSMVGTFTFCVLWIPLPILHYTGIETFELPTGKTAALLALSTLTNATFSGAFLILMSLTSPVLSSVAALLTIFLVAITDYILTGEPLSGATISGGLLIIVAFVLLSWATYREMVEEEAKKGNEEDKNFDENEAMLADSGLLDDDMDEDELGRAQKGRDSN
ncbi:hypothetical protein OHC33_006761 [Knufia fluminis]|uniref:EamA domain-containing protein n=1 Tax=Knufia fluminis TaxID=191047 RepID=A0AAN8EUE3_9EURO|nr:hypothetical protein OHC33_006761 [Knufia fluminis]